MPKRNKKKQDELSELRQGIWAIIDGVHCLASGLTYDEAAEKLTSLADGKGTIVTGEVAARLPKI